MDLPSSRYTPNKRRKVDETAGEVRTYTAQRILGKGSFGVVYQAQVVETGDVVAIKTIRQPDKDREVQILKELNGHPNIVELKGAFLSHDDKGEPRLNLVLEFLTDTLHRVIKHYNVLKQHIEEDYVRLYMYHLLRGLACLHGRGIAHCDIKPQNLLIDGATQTLKLCDFGTAKRLVFGEPLVSYACSRYYRAPEMCLGSVHYSTSVDLWAAGCVFGEMILGQPLFTGRDGIDQLSEIIQVLGTPTPGDLKAMNPGYPYYEFTPQISPHPWETVLRGWAKQEFHELIGELLRFNPQARLPPLQALLHNYFDALRHNQDESRRKLFDFTPQELLWLSPRERERLIPKWVTMLQAPLTPT